MHHKLFFQNYWFLVPICIYVVLFISNPLIEKVLKFECKRNTIVQLDLWLFENNVYYLLSIIQNCFFDFLAAFPYLFHFILPFIYLIYMIQSKQSVETILRFIFSFGITNVIGVLIQIIFPTPPPWMLLMQTKIPEANFYRVDMYIGFGLFKTIYAQSKIVCGAFPSLHVAWPSVILFNGQHWIGRWFCIAHVCLISFGAVYSMHHYLIDIVFGMLLAFVSCKIGKTITLEKESKVENIFNINIF